MPYRICIIDDEPNITVSFSSLLKDQGYRTETAGSAENGLRLITSRLYDLVLLDIQLPGMSGLEMLKQLKEIAPAPVTIVISGQADIPKAIEALRLGAVDFLEKPVPPERLIATVKTALLLASANRQRNLLVETFEDENLMIGASPAMKRLAATIAQVAPTDTTVLITGENGTGKELVASRLYLTGKRREYPFIKVNCPGIPETLFESELFGHLKGAFTGAVKDHPGKFVQADGGTIFLDEIGDLPASCQAKLLRVLESGEVETLGSGAHRQVDVRIICATNRPLERLVSERLFREDLFYRISVFRIDVPPLRRHSEDIPLLIGAFLRRFDPSGETHLTPDAIAHLTTLDYPGNVRQLKNLVERLTILHRGKRVGVGDIASQPGRANAISTDTCEESSLAERIERFERGVIESTLTACSGNISEAARKLSVDRANLSRRIKELGLKES
ncbi:MAG TPA: sigma-54 dependent transcriptional regulator [Candidatus Acidoferrum sp.]|nr:sigma-54 dependent transcriptional regulator [Candidatus Acidoferrum sp.]